ncbi:MAG: endonuclease III [Bacillota bacterium]|nr:endonuclease III [Bacillota bacterium]
MKNPPKGESAPEKRRRLDKALDKLKAAYPEARSGLRYGNAFELLVAAVLSAQCTDIQVNKVTENLFRKYPTPGAFIKAGEEKIAQGIKPCGFYTVKAKYIYETCRMLVENHGGRVPDSMQELLELPGVGRKTANVILSNAFGQDAIAVDTHVFRVANRIGFASAKDALETEMQLMENIPRENWSDAHHWLIFHGRKVCSARKPKCENCNIAECCLHHISIEKGKNAK